MSRRRVHYVLSTHWDREWYQTFQDYRYRLVRLLDRVIAGLQDGRLRGPFQCDGQAIILEDYLEVRPERRAEVVALAREGKFAIGPWYVLPDEFLVSGESLIRNLRLGRDVARALGAGPSDAGFVCDIFGHNSQMPQVFRGFGIHGGFIWRGTNAIDTCNVVWRGADGTEMPCYRFGPVGYCSYAALVRHARDHGQASDPERMRDDIRSYIREQAELSPVDPLLAFDGCDHQEWDEAHYAVLAECMDRDDEPYEIAHTSLDDYLGEMLSQRDRIETVLDGELREPGVHPGDVDSQWVIPGVLSSRVWIKQWNALCENLLCHWAEPFGAFAHAALGTEYPQGFLDVAWRWLLKNHPHDSICGCSIDRVHEDMRFRFAQCEAIARRLTTEATMQLAAHVEGTVEDDDLRVCLFSPLPIPFDETTEVTLQIPPYWPAFNEYFGYEPKPAFRVYDAEGQELPYQRLGQEMGRTKTRIRGDRFPETYRTNDVRISLPVRVPAMGYTTLTVRPGERGRPTRHPERPRLVTGERSMANEYLDVVVEANGTLTVTDKRTNRVYQRLLTYDDCADIGDGWYHGVAVNDRRFTSAAARSAVAWVHDGPMLATLRIRVTMDLPARFRFDTMTRSEETVPLVIDSLVSLRPGVDRIEVETTVHNTAEDHRLRVLFPTGAAAETYLSDTPFDAVERPIALPEDNHTYRELAVETRPQRSWTAVHQGGRGLAVVSTGLYESAVVDLPERPIALTMLRSTRRTVMTDGEPGGLLLGELRFRYWIVPLAGAPDPVRLGLLAQQVACGLRDVQLRPEDVALFREEDAPSLPRTAGYLSIKGGALLSSARRVGDALEVRLYNPTATRNQVSVEFGEMAGGAKAPRGAQRVNLESLPVADPMPVDDGHVSLSLAPKEIVTLRIT